MLASSKCNHSFAFLLIQDKLYCIIYGNIAEYLTPQNNISRSTALRTKDLPTPG